MTESRRIHFAPQHARNLAAETGPIDLSDMRGRSVPAWGHVLMLAPAMSCATMLAGYLLIGTP